MFCYFGHVTCLDFLSYADDGESSIAHYVYWLEVLPSTSKNIAHSIFAPANLDPLACGTVTSRLLVLLLSRFPIALGV